MFIRNFNQEEVRRGLYRAHGGGIAAMLFDRSVLHGILFLAEGILPPGNAIELHADPYEEIYYMLRGGGVMTVGDEKKRVSEGDAIWIPRGYVHGLENDTQAECRVLIIAAMPIKEEAK